ncbi:MAG: MBL fold metallo-hydrolase [Firmicutes bacterium]|jgi:phosphoribosyl 1,2-cyclic phosphodiesterase|nr:MBL fold metallo-hydrolase [Bacillota bacterium]
MKILPLASGSTGNALLVQENDTSILIDAGIGPRILKQRLASSGVALNDIRACLLTHEHSDHTQALARVTFPKSIKMVANAETWLAVEQQLDTSVYDFYELPVGNLINLGDLSVQSLPISHDGVNPVAYLVHAKSGKSFLYATDFGIMPKWFPHALKLADYVFIEANHDRQMLITGPYPSHLKRRVASPYGHLSNDQTAQILSKYLTPKTKKIYLGHLSQTNNTPQLALRTVSTALLNQGFDLNRLEIEAAAP